MSELITRQMERNWLDLENRLKRVNRELGTSYKYRNPFTTRLPLDRTLFTRGLQETENVINKLLKRCCPTCQFRLPFPRPFTPEGELNGWQLERDLAEMEAAVSRIDTSCKVSWDTIIYRTESAGVPTMRVRSFDRSTGVTTPDVTYDLASAYPGGWNKHKTKLVYRTTTNILHTLNTQDDDEANWFVEPLSLDLAGYGVGEYMRFLPPDGDYITFLASYSSGPVKLYAVKLSTMTIAWEIGRSDITSGTTGDIKDYMFSHDGRYLALDMGAYPERLLILDRVTGSLVASFESTVANLTFSGIDFSRDGQYFAHCASDVLSIYDADDFSLINSRSLPSDSPFPYIDDTSTYIAVSMRNTLRIYDMATLTQQASFSVSTRGEGDWCQQTDECFVLMDFDITIGSTRFVVGPPYTSPGKTSSGTYRARIRPFS